MKDLAAETPSRAAEIRRALRFLCGSAVNLPTAKSKNRSMNGTARLYFMWHEPNRPRYAALSDASVTVMYGGLPTCITH